MVLLLSPLVWRLLLVLVLLWVGLIVSGSYQRAEHFRLTPSQQLQLQQWADQAEALWIAKQLPALGYYLQQLQQQQQTVITLVTLEVQAQAGTVFDKDQQPSWQLAAAKDDWLQRRHYQQIQIHFPFRDQSAHLLIRLPHQMYPSLVEEYTWRALQLLALVVSVLLLLYWLYRFWLKPLQHLTHSARAQQQQLQQPFALVGGGCAQWQQTQQALTQLVAVYQQQLSSQRQWLLDWCDQWRAPLRRLQHHPQQQQVQREALHLRKLVEGAMQMIWLQQPNLTEQDQFDLVDVLNALCADARLAFPQCRLVVNLPEQALLQSHQRVLTQAIEHVLHSALGSSSAGSAVTLYLAKAQCGYLLHISDQAGGLAPQYLNQLFQPSFRLDKAGQRLDGALLLPLALAKRQLDLLGGCIRATNTEQGGLCLQLTIPTRGKSCQQCRWQPQA